MDTTNGINCPFLMNNCSIIVPVYKAFKELREEELLSLIQLYKVLGKHTIYLIGPAELNFGSYLNHSQKNCVTIITKTFDSIYFSSIEGYNRLLVSEFFYAAFSQYKFILIYQPDAWVFRDELDEWCKKEYDYVGAPWSGIHIYDNDLLEGVGNGGFSLRKISGVFSMLRKLRMLEVLEKYQHFNWKGILPRFPYVLLKLLEAIKHPCNFEKDYSWQEDVFWCKSAPKRLNSLTCNAGIIKRLARLLIKNDFKIAPVETALQFSIETNPKELYNLNNGQLPFGCHAWEKYDPEFWKAFIPVG